MPSMSAAVVDGTSNSAPSTPPFSKCKRTVMLVVIVGEYFITGLIFSMLPPFYHLEAEERGLHPLEFGFVFGIAHLASLIATPFAGKWTVALRPKLVHLVGSFVQILTGSFLFGFLVFIRSPWIFLICSYILRHLRFFYGVGEAAAVCAALGMLIFVFPERSASMVGLHGTFFGLGQVAGPAVGTFLYLSGGFAFPFFLLGTLAAVLFVAAACVLPQVEDGVSNVERKGRGKEKLTLTEVLKSPLIWLPFVDHFVMHCGNGFMEAMLGHYAEIEVGMSTIEIGEVFLVTSLPVLLVTPAVGYLMGKSKNPLVMGVYPVVGDVFMMLGMALTPMSLVPAAPTPAFVFSSALVIGCGYAFASVSCYARGEWACTSQGYPTDLQTILMLSSLWQFSFSGGNFVGPSIAGILVEEFGFRPTASLFFIIYSYMALLNIVIHLLSVLLIVRKRDKVYTISTPQ